MLAPRGMVCLKKGNIKQRLWSHRDVGQKGRRNGQGSTQPCEPVVSGKGECWCRSWQLSQGGGGGVTFSLLRRVGKAETVQFLIPMSRRTSDAKTTPRKNGQSGASGIPVPALLSPLGSRPTYHHWVSENTADACKPTTNSIITQRQAQI